MCLPTVQSCDVILKFEGYYGLADMKINVTFQLINITF